MNKAQYETDRANAYLGALADANMAGASFAAAAQAGALAVATFDFDFRTDADTAEYAFNLYCAEYPGVNRAEILDAMSGFDLRDAAFWKLAHYYAQAAHSDWCAA